MFYQVVFIRLKKISASCVDSAGKHIYLGTENGNVYIMDLEKFDVLDSVIYVDVIMQKYARAHQICTKFLSNLL